MAIVTALRGFNDLGRSVTPTFLSRISVWEVQKKIEISVHGTSNPATLRLQGA